MKSSWRLLVLLAVTHYGTEFVHARWHAYTAMGGLTMFYLLHQVKAPPGSMLWLVCAWGMYESLQVFVCQSIGAFTLVETKQFQGMCDAQTGLPFFNSGLLFELGLSVLWLVRNRSERRTRSRP